MDNSGSVRIVVGVFLQRAFCRFSRTVIDDRQAQPMTEDDEWEYAPNMVVNPEISFCGALQIAGLRHVIHNASLDMLEVTPTLLLQVRKYLAPLSRLLHRKFTRNRLFSTCYDSPMGQAMAMKYHPVLSEVYENRWASVFKCCSDVVQNERMLRWGWDLVKYKGRSSTKTDAEIDMVNTAIESEEFWFYMRALRLLGVIVEEAMDWIGGCPCHSCWETPDMDKELLASWRKCICKSFRLPELCAGDLLTFIRDCYIVCTGLLVRDNPLSVARVDRDRVLNEFHDGQSHFMFMLTMKLGPYQEPPFLVAAGAHHEEHVRRSALQKCLSSDCPHPVIRELQTPPVRPELEEYLDGWREFSTCHQVTAFVARFKFSSVDETRVENVHASLERRTGNFQNRSLAYDSMVVRFPFLKTLLKRFPDFRGWLTDMLSKYRSPGNLIKSFGFAAHPTILEVSNNWSPLWREIFYRNDPYTLYRSELASYPCRSFGLRSGGRLLDGVARNPASIYAELLHLAAVDAVQKRMEAMKGIKNDEAVTLPVYFSCRFSAHALMSVSSLFSCQNTSAVAELPWLEDSGRGVVLSQATVGPWEQRQRRGNHIFFSIRHARPANLRLARKGTLSRAHVALNVHKVFDVARDDGGPPRIWLSSTPVNLDMLGDSSMDVRATSVLLLMNALPLEALQNIRVFHASGEMKSTLDLTGYEHPPTARPTSEAACFVAEHLLHGSSSNAPAGAEELMDWLYDHGALEMERGSRRLKESWGHNICHGWWVTGGSKLLAKRSPEESNDFDLYEIMCCLEEAGWRMQSVRKRLPEAECPPYVAGGGMDKVWYVRVRSKSKRTMSLVMREYVLALATAQSHGKRVPHFQSKETYLRILDPTRPERQPRQRRVVEYVNPDDEFAPVPSQRPKLAKPRRVNRRGDGSDGDGASESGSCNGSGSGKSSSSSSESSSSTSSPSEQLDSSSSEDEVPVEAPVRGEHAKRNAGRTVQSRLTESRVPFGLSWMTPRHTGGVISGWFCHCTNPRHRDQRRCTKEVGVKVSGSSERALQLLKAWVVFGEGCKSSVDHHKSFSMILGMGADLPSTDQLDALAPCDWPELDWPVSEATTRVDDDADAPRKRRKKAVQVPDAPEHVHAVAVGMWESGELKPTTLEQRRRNGRLPGISYGTPTRYTELLKWGYIGPNLPPPSGFHWRCQPGQWVLCERGG